MKERFSKEGISNFQPHEVLEFLLYYAVPRKDTNLLAHQLLEHFGSLQNVLEAEIEELTKVEGIRLHSATLLHLIPQLSGYYLQEKNRNTVFLNSSGKAGEYVKSLFMGKKYEAFYLIHLNTRNGVYRAECLQKGTLNEAAVYPRLVVESVLKHKTGKLILAHNHPGGSLDASSADIRLTKKLTEALKLIDVQIIDHFIVAGDDIFSFAEKGLL